MNIWFVSLKCAWNLRLYNDNSISTVCGLILWCWRCIIKHILVRILSCDCVVNLSEMCCTSLVLKLFVLKMLRHSPRVKVCCSVLQRVAVCCSVLQCVAVCCSVLQPLIHTSWHMPVTHSYVTLDSEFVRCVTNSQRWHDSFTWDMPMPVNLASSWDASPTLLGGHDSFAYGTWIWVLFTYGTHMSSFAYGTLMCG